MSAVLTCGQPVYRYFLFWPKPMCLCCPAIAKARTVLEALATGRPIITTDAPGCRETVLHDDNGFLIPPRSVDGLVRAMRRFLADPAIMDDMAARSCQIARDKYCADKVASSMLGAMGILNEV